MLNIAVENIQKTTHRSLLLVTRRITCVFKALKGLLNTGGLRTRHVSRARGATLILRGNGFSRNLLPGRSFRTLGIFAKLRFATSVFRNFSSAFSGIFVLWGIFNGRERCVRISNLKIPHFSIRNNGAPVKILTG